VFVLKFLVALSKTDLSSSFEAKVLLSSFPILEYIDSSLFHAGIFTAQDQYSYLSCSGLNFRHSARKKWRWHCAVIWNN